MTKDLSGELYCLYCGDQLPIRTIDSPTMQHAACATCGNIMTISIVDNICVFTTTLAAVDELYKLGLDHGRLQDRIRRLNWILKESGEMPLTDMAALQVLTDAGITSLETDFALQTMNGKVDSLSTDR